MKKLIQAGKGKELNVFVNHKNTEAGSMLFNCNKVEYMCDRGTFMEMPTFDHHLMFWRDKKLLFKVWLRNRAKDKAYKDIYEALKHVGIKVFNKL